MKKVLILDTRLPIEQMTENDIVSTSSLYKYYVGKKLLKMGAVVDCRYSGSSREPSWDNFFSSLESYLKKNGPYHAIISMAQRGYISRGKDNGRKYYNILKKYANKVNTICDNVNVIGLADTTYYAVPVIKGSVKSKEHRSFIQKNAKYVGWAADPNTCIYNNKPSDDIIRVLIDHSYYENKPYRDSSKDIILSAEKYLSIGKRKEKIEFNRFVSNKGIDKIKKDGNYFEVFNRGKGLNHINACKHYSKSDIFVVTHAESMGLSVIESAMAGCLILSPKGYINSSLISPLLHLEFDPKKDIPWDKAINMINHSKAHSLAKKYNWDHVSSVIADDLLK